MTSDSGLTLTALDKILLHLRDNWHHRNDKIFPAAMTQKGISGATGLRLSHVPRSMKVLIDRELVRDIKAHVEGEKRRYKSYILTDKGLAEANILVGHLKTMTVEFQGQEKHVSEILGREKFGPLLPVLLTLAGDGDTKIPVKRIMAGPVPPIEGFVNRKDELERLTGMLEDPLSRVMVIYGSSGYGTSTLAARFLDMNRHKWNAAWIPMHKSFPEVRKEMERILRQLIPEMELEPDRPEKLAARLDGQNIILVMDDYFEATDDLVEYLVGFIGAIKEIKDFKLMVTARESTPSYDRFYTIMDIHDGTVGEVHIRGLDMEHCQLILGTPDIDPEAMRRLFMFTMGKPATLKLLAAGDAEAMKEQTRFSPEEIKLMLYLKSQRV